VITRRDLFSMAAATGVVPAISQMPLTVPVQLVLDAKAKWRAEHIGHFWSHIWPEAVRDLGRCGIRLQSNRRDGEVSRLHLLREPIITGLDRSALNLVITDRIPVQWDNGRALSGVTTRYRGHHLCMIAMNRAHGHQIPFLSVNTCVHELLHALLHDIFEGRPKGFFGEAREFRIDLYATRLWLFHDGAAIRQAAQAYVSRLRSGLTERT
jgi:hypothetical protein